MRSSWPMLLVLAVLVAGCGGPEEEAPREAPPDGLAGTWILDVEAFEASFVPLVEEQLRERVRNGDLTEEEAKSHGDRLRTDLRERFSTAWSRFELREDGTFASDGNEGTRAGTWKLQGTRLSLTILEHKDAPKSPPDVWYGTFRPGAITLRPEADKDYELVLHPAQ